MIDAQGMHHTGGYFAQRLAFRVYRGHPACAHLPIRLPRDGLVEFRAELDIKLDHIALPQAIGRTPFY